MEEAASPLEEIACRPDEVSFSLKQVVYRCYDWRNRPGKLVPANNPLEQGGRMACRLPSGQALTQPIRPGSLAKPLGGGVDKG